MLHKDPGQRISDGQALLQLLASVPYPTLADDAQAVTVQLDRPDGGAAFASDEQQLLSVVIASLPAWGAEDCTPIEPRGTPAEFNRRDELRGRARAAGRQGRVAARRSAGGDAVWAGQRDGSRRRRRRASPC